MCKESNSRTARVCQTGRSLGLESLRSEIIFFSDVIHVRDTLLDMEGHKGV
jgi:hypothetical protein